MLIVPIAWRNKINFVKQKSTTETEALHKHLSFQKFTS